MDEKITTQAEESLETLTICHQDGDGALDAQIVSFQNKNTYTLSFTENIIDCLFKTNE